MSENKKYIKNYKKGDKVTTNDSWFLTKGFNNATGVIVGFEKDEVGSWQYLINLDDGRTLKCDDSHLIN